VKCLNEDMVILCGLEDIDYKVN